MVIFQEDSLHADSIGADKRRYPFELLVTKLTYTIGTMEQFQGGVAYAFIKDLIFKFVSPIFLEFLLMVVALRHWHNTSLLCWVVELVVRFFRQHFVEHRLCDFFRCIKSV